MGLELYQKKRDLLQSGEPGPAKTAPSGNDLCFVVQKHDASHLHYDFRLELDGVLKSWAIPKGPSLDPAVKRLAMLVEDHPYEYRKFEGTIPKGNYGAGEVIIWDEGTYRAPGASDRPTSEKLIREGFRKGDVKFVLEGQKLKGQFALVRIKTEKGNSWLLLKKQDQWASSDDVTKDDRSVVSNAVLGDRKPASKEKEEPASKPPRHRAAISNADTEKDDVGVHHTVDIATVHAADNATPSAAAAAATTAPVVHDAAGVAAAMPHEITPMLATLVDKPFDDPNWLFEIKQDGYRAIAEIELGEVRLYSRKNTSFNRQFPSVVRSLESIPGEAILDGELVVLDENGRSYFQLLQNHLRNGQGNLSYFVFDLLYANGMDLRTLPLVTRKEMLRDLLPELPDIRFNDHIAEFGTDFFQLARDNHLEGIIAKRRDSRYETGRRSKDWLKIKIRLQQEAIICGFTEPRGSRKSFGALVLGAFEGNELVHIGFCGGGFDDQLLKEIYGKLQTLVQPESPFKRKVKAETRITWVRPVLVCEVTFSEWTDEWFMRMPVFLGLRDDRDPATVIRERATNVAEEIVEAKGKEPPPRIEKLGRLKEKELTINGHKLKLSNLDKVFWPDEGYTKGDVIDYYRQVAQTMLPYLKDRPESMYRTPNGIGEKGFFQKEAGELPPGWVATQDIHSNSLQKSIKFVLCQDEATLVYMANLGCIEINPWLSRLQHLDFPDYFVIDLDPEDISFDRVVDTALAVHEVLDRAGVPSFPKTSGATGIHIYVPLGAKYDYDTAGKFALLVATLAHHQLPAFTSLVRDPRKRQQKVYLDFLQNKPGQTLAAPYSLRPRPGAPVSTPLRWEEVRIGLDPRQFTIETMPARIGSLGDLFHGVLGPGIDMESAIERLERSQK